MARVHIVFFWQNISAKKCSCAEKQKPLEVVFCFYDKNFLTSASRVVWETLFFIICIYVFGFVFSPLATTKGCLTSCIVFKLNNDFPAVIINQSDSHRARRI